MCRSTGGGGSSWKLRHYFVDKKQKKKRAVTVGQRADGFVIVMKTNRDELPRACIWVYTGIEKIKAILSKKKGGEKYTRRA